jgi:hypothetical protein
VSVQVLCRTQLDEERDKIPSSTHGDGAQRALMIKSSSCCSTRNG